ncbi:uncharacterized protein KGF55_001883 [Candida pseudojiufengensis]|uniref:uncharacterized protein n=1 Tax=Candida pseudojiufengensis TaxID=497109 RepID=UPI0022256F5A|nr:uncharacterized protein KGF55_001883 [Candida pseudojiufengensis]KAI5964813.1 hypothetical protein KGF55_001883 [Candida pseudojiufengensis]
MFSLGKKRLLNQAKVQLRFKSSTNTNFSNQTLINYAILGFGSLSVGFLIGKSLNKSKSTKKATPIPPTTSTASNADLNDSTAPVSTLQPPKYANEKEFEEGLDKIINIVGKDHISFEKEELDSHNDSFFSTHHPPNPDKQRPNVVISPNSTEQVSEIVKVAHHYRIPIVASSGLTSLEGQNIHTRGPFSIALSFSEMNKILAFHPEDLDMVVQPGVSWSDIADYLDNKGSNLLFGPDPGLGACIGGMSATSCSGTNAFKYGTMKENVVNLTVVLADGTVIKTRQRPRKSAAGYDLTRFFIGTEGTAGIITEATIKLHVKPKFELITTVAFPSIKDAAATASTIIEKGIQPNAMEMVNDTMMSFVNEQSDDKKLEKPTLFFKLGGPTIKAIDEQNKVITEIANKQNAIKVDKSSNADQNEELWAARRAGLWSTFQYGEKCLKDPKDVQVWTTDIAVPISNVSKVISEVNDDLNEAGFKDKFSILSHVGDGNCHFIILYNSPDYAKVHKAVDRMVDKALKYDGTCTGEHGVGLGKRKYLDEELGEAAIDTMRKLKLALDPRRILNPDKIFKIDPNDTLDEQLEAGHSRLYRSQDGLSICQYGHVLDGAIEFDDEQDTFSVSTRRLNAVAVDERGNFESQSSQRTGNKVMKQKLTGDEAMPIYFKCLQILLKNQLQSIIKLYFSDGVKNELTLIVKTNWCKTLNYYYGEYKQDQITSDRDKRSVDVLDLLCIIYISSLQLKSYPFYLTDLLEIILEDKVPFFKTLHLLPADELNKLHGTYYERLQAHEKPTNALIYRRLFNLNPILLDKNLPISITYYYSYVYRILADLILPNTPDLFIMIYEFLKILNKDNFEIPHKIKTQKQLIDIFPEVYLSSVIVFTIKLYFEHQPVEYHNSWLMQVRNFDREYEYNHNLNDEILLSWSKDKTQKYCDWIYNHLMPHKYKDDSKDSEELTVMEKRLFQIFSMNEQKEKLDTDEMNDSDNNDLMNESDLMTTKFDILKQITDTKNYEKHDSTKQGSKFVGNTKDLDLFLFNKLSTNLNLNVESFQKHYLTISKTFNTVHVDSAVDLYT